MLRGLRRLLGPGVPECPICEGPCTHEFPRSEWVFPDHLPESDDGSADPVPVKAPKPNRRGRRPAEDRARKPDEDRAK